MKLAQDKVRASEDALLDELRKQYPVADRRGRARPGARSTSPRRPRRRGRARGRLAASSRHPLPTIAGARDAGAAHRRRTRRADEGDWRWQLRHAISSADDLARAAPADAAASSKERGAPSAKGSRSASRRTTCRSSTATIPACPIRRQCVPDAREGDDVPGDLVDPLGEVAHEVAPHLVQRYPDRVLLLATDRCAVYCRFCTRSRMVGDGDGAVSLEALAPAFAWLRAHPEVRDVIVSGGDPLAMATDRIVRLVAASARSTSVETIRLATRVPVTLPMRITRGARSRAAARITRSG